MKISWQSRYFYQLRCHTDRSFQKILNFYLKGSKFLALEIVKRYHENINFNNYKPEGKRNVCLLASDLYAKYH